MVYSFINQNDKGLLNTLKSKLSFRCRFIDKNQDLNALIFNTLSEYLLGFSGNVTFLTNVSLFDFIDKNNDIESSVFDRNKIENLLEKTKTQITYLIEEETILNDEKLKNLLKNRYKCVIIKGKDSKEKLEYLLKYFQRYLKDE